MLIRIRTINICLLLVSLSINYLYLTGKIEGSFFSTQQATANTDYVSTLEVQLYDKNNKRR